MADWKKAWSAAKQGLEKGLDVAQHVAQVVVEESANILQSKHLRDYKLGAPVATCGPGDVWAIYSGTSKKQGAINRDVSIWILDKKRLQESCKQSTRPKSFDVLFEQQKKACQTMTRMKIPGVVKVIEPLDDTSNQMVLITEPIKGSLKNILTHFSAVPGAAKDEQEITLSHLDIKQGLLHVTDTLTFLHNEAKLVHGGLSPGAIMITAEGAWKLAGFAFSVASSDQQSCQFNYSDPFPPLWDELSKPCLSYAAPEQVGGSGGTASISASGGVLTASADVFSLAATVYELLTQGKQLLPVRSSVSDYKAKVTSLSAAGNMMLPGVVSDELSAVPASIQGVLRSMLSLQSTARPAVGALTASTFFQDDMLLKALRFLDTMLSREPSQKLAFIKDLAQVWTQFDDRVLQLRVLPPLIQELRSEQLLPMILPLVLRMMDKASPTVFASQLLPALQPVLEHAQGEVLGILLGGSNVLAKLMTQEAMGRFLIPLYSRALDSDTSPHVQELCLGMLQAALQTLDYSLLKQQLMPRVYGVCKRTTASAIRSKALALMTKAVSRLDREEAAAMVDTAALIVSVDRTAATITAVVQLSDALSQQHGVEVTAARLLPLITPLLVAPALTAVEFDASHKIAQAMLDRIHAHVSGGRGAAGPDGALQLTGTTAGAGISGNAASSWDASLEPLSYRTQRQTAAASNISQSHPPATSQTSTSSWTTAVSLSTAQQASNTHSTGSTMGTSSMTSNNNQSNSWISSTDLFSGNTGSASTMGGGAGKGAGVASGGSLFGGLSVHDGAASNTGVASSSTNIAVGNAPFSASGGLQSTGSDLFSGMSVNQQTSHVPSGMGMGGIGGLGGRTSLGAAGSGLSSGDASRSVTPQVQPHAMMVSAPMMSMKGNTTSGLGSSKALLTTVSSNDPFSNLSAIALSAPPPPKPVHSNTNNVDWFSNGGMSSFTGALHDSNIKPGAHVNGSGAGTHIGSTSSFLAGALPPPPKAGSTVHSSHASTSATKPATNAQSIDLLW